MIITAKKFIGAPLEAFRRADKGEDVTITHARYPDIEFKLTSKPKETTKESKADPEKFKISTHAAVSNGTINPKTGMQNTSKVDTNSPIYKSYLRGRT